MDEKKLAKLLEDLCSFEQLKLSNIPDIDLYMDQITTFIDEKFSYIKRDLEDASLTKTMINNYTKAGILMPPKKKKYSKQHMILIILTYYLKQIISINDIHDLFSPLVQSINSGENHDKDLEYIYNTFLAIEKSETEKFNHEFQENFINHIKQELGEEDNFEEHKDISKLIMIVISLVLKANIQKRMAEKIIDEFFK
ncbi:DUF1836 domain-containing protein [Clostridium sp. DJ247]|uniref:DUF1836 domain-containing protein n=1 Tax=Clostridium sp. DJ247 TaxID=2726188 RepID=UPI001626292D|nr:DUF1836 domain-containing protein [Clostridium sp. DJ247]MBC2579665.1 DUF1836 domain-containing protein [Clostridium sp. DJ247]